MGYTKIVAYGNTLELYQYDKSLAPRKPVRRKDENGDGSEVLVSSRANSLSDLSKEAYEGKRRDNAKRTVMVFRRLVAAQLGGPEVALLATLTYRENQTDLKAAYRDLLSFIQALRYKFGKLFRYIAVPEFQKRGAVHFHCLFWGLPDSVFREERISRLVATTWGQGFVYLKMTDGNERLSSYLSKYMAKAFTDFRLRGQKSYVASRNVIRPVYQPIDDNLLTLSTWLSTDSSTLHETQYPTQWLGRCNYKKYQIKG